MRPVIADGKPFFSGYLADPRAESVHFSSFSSFKPVLLSNTGSANDVLDEYQIPEAVPCFDQLEIGSCVLNAWVGLLEILLGVEGKQPEMLSRLFTYFQCRKMMSTVDKDSGTFPYLAADRLMRIGAVPESLWKYDPGLLTTPPGLELYSIADDNKITNAYRFTDPVTQGDDMEASVRRDHPVVIAVGISREMMEAGPNDVLDVPDPKDIIGGHSMLATGVRKLRSGARQWRIRGSWGTDYCDRGHVLLTDRYVMTSDDSWTGTRMDSVLL